MFLSVIFAVLFVACYPCGIFPMDDSPRRDVLFFSCAPPLPPPGTKKLYTLVLDNHERALFPTKFVTILLGEKKNSRAVKWTEGLCHAHHPYGAAPPSPLSRAHWPLFAGVLAHHHDPALTRCVARMKGFSGGPRMIFLTNVFFEKFFFGQYQIYIHHSRYDLINSAEKHRDLPPKGAAREHFSRK